MTIDVKTRYNDVNLGFITLNLRSPGQFSYGDERWDFKLKSIKTDNEEINQELLSCEFKKDFFGKSFSGQITFKNGSKIILRNNDSSGYKEVLVEFFDGEKLQISLEKVNGGVLYEDQIYLISMPEFEHHSLEGRSIEKVTIVSQQPVRFEIKVLGLLICSHYFDYQFESSIG